MKKLLLITLTGASMLITGCGKETDAKNKSPAFMFWCYREEVVSDDFHIPDMSTPAHAAYIQNRLKVIPGFVRSQWDQQGRTLTISYQSSTIRKMNFEEAIAMLGFSVNGRPADPKAELPAGVK
jgi:outer membrane biogenesis lipoprotein LolB